MIYATTFLQKENPRANKNLQKKRHGNAHLIFLRAEEIIRLLGKLSLPPFKS